MGLVEKAFELQPAIERIGTFVRDCRCFPGLDQDRASLLAVVQQVEQLHANLGTPLRVLLVGGTGVGKSSLFNAIAGAEIAVVSHKRPTTQRLTAYFHRESGTAALGALEAEAVLRPHERETLREKVIIDAPDFDSSVLENHENLFRALEVADLVLCVVTPEKYMSRELFRVLERYRHGRTFVYVMNKADLGVEPVVVDDFRRALAEDGLPCDRVFVMSARAAYDDQVARRGYGPAAGDFPALMALMEKELDRVQIREIKSHNLVDRVDRLIGRVGKHIPVDADTRLTNWSDEARASFRDLAREIGSRFTDALFRTPELRNVAAYLYGTSFGFIFGAFLRFAQWFRAAARTGAGTAIPHDLEDVKTLVHDRLARTDSDAVAGQIRLLLAGFVEAGVERGFARAALEPHLTAEIPAGEVAAVYREIETDWAAEFTAAFDDIITTRPGGVERQNLGFNLLPGAFVLFVVYKIAVQFVSGTPLGLDYLVSALVLLSVLCYLQWRFAEVVIGRNVDRTFARLTEHLHRRVEARLEERFLKGTSRTIEDVRAALAEFAGIQQTFADISRALGESATEPAALPPMPDLQVASAGADEEDAGMRVRG